MKFWKTGDRAFELWSPKVIRQKVEYIHQNPVRAEVVRDGIHYKYSSAGDYAGIKGYIPVEIVELNEKYPNG